MRAFANEAHTAPKMKFTQLANNYIHWDHRFFFFLLSSTHTHTHRFRRKWETECEANSRTSFGIVPMEFVAFAVGLLFCHTFFSLVGVCVYVLYIPSNSVGCSLHKRLRFTFVSFLFKSMWHVVLDVLSYWCCVCVCVFMLQQPYSKSSHHNTLLQLCVIVWIVFAKR